LGRIWSKSGSGRDALGTIRVKVGGSVSEVVIFHACQNRTPFKKVALTKGCPGRQGYAEATTDFRLSDLKKI